MKAVRSLLTLVFITLFAGHAFAAEYLVKYKSQAGLRTIQSFSTGLGPKAFRMIGQHDAGQYVLVNIDKSQEVKVLADLIGRPQIEWVVPNFKIHAFGDAQATALREQWALAKIQSEKAWVRANNKGARKITIAVIDTGVDYKHQNLAPNMVPGYDFKGNDADPMDETGAQNPGHGTHCAGIAAASGQIENGVSGSGPEVNVMPIRFLGADGSGDLNAAIRSIDYAIEKGVQVISASWGAAVPRSQAGPLIEAVQRADDKGIIFVAAAANDGKNNDVTEVFPANSNTPNMISVAASGSGDEKPSWSNYGKMMVHLASPGLKIMSTLPNGSYGDLSGTSMATPLVAGVVAFLRAQDSSLTGLEIRSLLQTTGVKVGIETACNCRIDQFAATDHLLNKKPWLVPAAITIPENGSVNVKVRNGQAPFKFTSANAGVVSIDDSGLAKAVAKGSTTISVTDANGVQLTSLDYHVGMPASDGGGGGGGAECPLDPAMCQILCGIMPDMPWCSK